MATINAPQNLMKSLLQQRNAILEAEIERLRAELAECREDAERYRWLRKIADMDFFEPPNSAVCNAVTPEHLDEIIDAALAMNDAAREGEGEA